MPRKKKQEVETLEPSLAILDAFKQAKNAIRCVSLQETSRVKNVISTGSLIADLKLGGGIQFGRVVHIYGPEASGKSTFLQGCAVAVQATWDDVPIVHYDTEVSADPTYMRVQGLDLYRTIKVDKKNVPLYFYAQPEHGDGVYEHMHRFLEKFPDVDPNKVDRPSCVILIDSVAAMLSKDRNRETGEGAVGLEARMHSRMLPFTRSQLMKKAAILIASNQIRMNINMRMPGVNPEGFTGGNAWKYYPDYTIRVHGRKKVEEDRTGMTRQHVWARTTKNKTFRAFQEFELDIILGSGIDKAQDSMSFLEALGLVERKQGRNKILLKRFATEKYLSWQEFRAIAETDEFRQYCFGLLKKDATYKRYFKLLGSNNYNYANVSDADYSEVTEEEVKNEQ